MIEKDGSIVLNNFQVGQAASPYLGYASIRNAEVVDVPGVAQIQRALSLKFTSVGLGLAIVRDVSQNEFVGTDAGYLYRNGSVLTSGLGIVYDLLIYKGYLLVFRDTAIDIMDIVSLSYTSNWKTGLTSGYYHKAIADPDNDVFIANGNYIAKITGFSAGSPPTATFTLQEKTLPSGYYAQTLAMLGILLAIGTLNNASSYTDLSSPGAKILFWDRASTLFEDGFVDWAESGSQMLFNTGNALLVAAGLYGNIYQTNGNSAGDPIKTINFNTDKAATMKVMPNAVAKLDKEIIIGTSTQGDVYPSISKHGIRSITKGAILKNTISNGEVGGNTLITIGAIYASTIDQYRKITASWRSGLGIPGDPVTYGIDETSTPLYDGTAENLMAVIEGPLERVGTPNNLTTYTQGNVLLAKPLLNGQSIRISYRNNLTDSFTTIATLTMASGEIGAVSISFTADIPSCELLQCEIRMYQTGTAEDFLKNINLMELRIRK